MGLRTSTANGFIEESKCGVTIQILYSRVARSSKPMKSYDKRASPSHFFPKINFVMNFVSKTSQGKKWREKEHL